MNEIALSISQHFFQKENRAPEKNGSNRWAFAAFDNVTWTVPQIIAHVRSGKAICVAATLNNHRKSDYFKSAQIMGVDFDKGPDVTGLLLKPLVYDYAFLVYATASSTDDAPRSRALFALDAPISDAEEYRKMVKRLLLAFEVENVDEQCKDPVRIFYGSWGKKVSDVPNAVLPVEVLVKLPPHPDELEKPPPDVPLRLVETSDKRGMTRLEAYGRTAKENILNELALLPDGQDMRHGAINRATMVLAAFSKGGFPGVDGWENDIRSLGRQWGRATQEIEASITGAYAKADPHPLALPDRPAPPLVSSNGNGAHPEPPPDPSDYVTEPPPVAPPAPPVQTWHTSAESMVRYRERLTTARTDGRLPLPFPFRALHEFGGFCRVLAPGVMVGIVGMSGGMKTSFVETITDSWRQMDPNDVLWYGPEWNWEKMGDRAVQRYGGANMTDVLMHELYMQEMARGLVVRDGKALPKGVYEDSLRISQEIERWAGMNHYIEQMDVDIDDLLIGSAQRLADAKAMGRTIRIAVWDYLQLMDMRSARTEQERITTILGRLKAFCVENGLIGIVASQVTKTASADTKENQKLLTSEAGQFFRGDKFNLVLTLNPIYDGKLLTDKGYINVDKNSIGRTGAVEVFINPARLKWVDSVAGAHP